MYKQPEEPRLSPIQQSLRVLCNCMPHVKSIVPGPESSFLGEAAVFSPKNTIHRTIPADLFCYTHISYTQNKWNITKFKLKLKLNTERPFDPTNSTER